MKETGTQIVAFNVSQHDSPEALKAYETIAGQTDGLAAIFVYQYHPYEGGKGRIFWVRDKQGIEIPVITAKYAIWAGKDKESLAGTPTKIARLIRERVGASALPSYEWVIVHAWSYFRKAPGNDEAAEDMNLGETQGGVRGFSPAFWSAKRLPESIRVISPLEMAWRIRMQHNPEQSRKLLYLSRTGISESAFVSEVPP